VGRKKRKVRSLEFEVALGGGFTTWMSQEVDGSMVRINGFHLLVNGGFIGVLTH